MVEITLREIWKQVFPFLFLPRGSRLLTQIFMIRLILFEGAFYLWQWSYKVKLCVIIFYIIICTYYNYTYNMIQWCNNKINTRKYFSSNAMNMKTESLEDGWKKVSPISPEVSPLLILMIYNNERNKTTQRPLSSQLSD